MEILLPSPLKIPSIWKQLLDIEDFDALPSYPEKAHLSRIVPQPYLDEAGGVRADWPHPLRDDCRQVGLKVDGYLVRLTLVSGNNNYFTQVTVVLPDGRELCPDEPSFDLDDEDSVREGDLVVRWKQELV